MSRVRAKPHGGQKAVGRGRADLHRMVTVERGAHGVDRQLGAVAVAAEVSEHDMAQRGRAGPHGQVGGGAIGEMAVGDMMRCLMANGRLVSAWSICSS